MEADFRVRLSLALLGILPFAAPSVRGADAPPATLPDALMAPVIISRPATLGSSPVVSIPPIPEGPFQPTWESLRDNYKPPQWLADAKFGLSMHWGLYSVPARQSEWYVRYIYGGNAGISNDHVRIYGPYEKFGYKDFISMFTAEKWDPHAWAALFKKAGVKFIVPTVEHHDGFSLWNSALNKYNAKNMGPKRELMEELAAAVRKEGIKFGVANHSMEHFEFLRPTAAVHADLEAKQADLFDPEWAEFYHVADRSPEERERFNQLWLAKNIELIDKFQPDVLWFDNGLNSRGYDPVKLHVAAYYYNRAKQWGKDVTLSTKGEGQRAAYLYGTMRDYERQGRILPRGIKDFLWEVDDPIGSKFGYVKEIQYKPASLLVRRIVDTVSMNGIYMMNISPLPDGTIPQEQQERLLEIGKWLEVNGEAIYGTRPWGRYGEGPYYDSPTGPPQGAGPDDPPNEAYSGKEFRFTTKGDTLYAIATDWPGEQAVITSLANNSKDLPLGKIEKVELLGHPGNLSFSQDAEGLKVQMPAEKPCDYAYALKITGLKPMQLATPAATPAADSSTASPASASPTEIPQ